MHTILIAYTTNAGSTGEVAQALGESLIACGDRVEVRRLEDVDDLSAYDTVILGAPMILGWHRAAIRFAKKHAKTLSQKRVAYFATAMSLTTTPAAQADAPNLFLDPTLAASPKNPQRMSLKERYTLVSNYLRPMLKAAPTVKPVSVAFFGGKLEIFRLKWWQAIFVMAAVQAQPGDYRNWDAIKAWGEYLASAGSSQA